MSRSCARCFKKSTDLFLCGNCDRAAYCGEECASAHWRQHSKICLRVDEPDEAGPPIDDDSVIGFETEDGKKFRVPIDVARQFVTVKFLVEDAGADNYVPLPTIQSRTFMILLDAVQKEWLFKAENLSDEDFFAVFLAANYLDIAAVVNLLIPFAPNRFMRTKNVEAVRTLRSYVPRIILYCKKYYHANSFAQSMRDVGIPCNDIENKYDFATQAALIALQKDFVDDFKRLRDFSEQDFYLMDAVEAGSLKIAKLFLEDRRVDPSDEENECLIEAAEKGNIEMVKLLLQDERVVKGKGLEQALVNAVIEMKYEMVRFLLKDGRFDPNATNTSVSAKKENQGTCLEIARKHGHAGILSLLLEDPRTKVSAETIIWAASRGLLEMVKDLSERFPVKIALAVAARDGQFDVVEFLLSKIAIDEDISEALGAAVRSNHKRIVMLLIRDGRANPAFIEEEDWHTFFENGNVTIDEAREIKKLIDDENTKEILTDYIKSRKLRVSDVHPNKLKKTKR